MDEIVVNDNVSSSLDEASARRRLLRREDPLLMDFAAMYFLFLVLFINRAEGLLTRSIAPRSTTTSMMLMTMDFDWTSGFWRR